MTTFRTWLANILAGIGIGIVWVADRVRPTFETDEGGPRGGPPK